MGAIAAYFRRKTVALLSIRWAPLTGATLLSHLTLYAVLGLNVKACQRVDGAVGWQRVLATFAFIRLLSALPITGSARIAMGVGVDEAGAHDPHILLEIGA